MSSNKLCSYIRINITHKRYYDYIDNPEALIGTGFEGMVSEERLPVILDGRGGYYHFSEKDFGFVRLLETDADPPLTVEQMFFKNNDNFKLGWMSPEGDTYSCDYTSHTKCAQMIVDKYFPGSSLPERTLGKAGWLKIIDSWDGTQREHGQFVYSLSGKLTKRQADKLFDLGLYDNAEVKEMIADCEDSW